MNIDNPTIDEVVDIWCKALESGEYKQTQGALCKIKNGEKEYCCLGVLAEEYQKLKGDLNINQLYNDIENRLQFNETTGTLPYIVIRWSNIRWSDGRYGDGYKSLMEDNDINKKTFPEIAQIIRDNKDTLFAQEEGTSE